MLEIAKPAMPDRLPILPDVLPAEANFYSSYDWSLDPHLTFAEAVERLAGEIERLPATSGGWQTDEVVTNIYMLSCSLLNGIDEYLRGHTLRLPARLARARPGRVAWWVTERVAENLPRPSRRQIRRWREEWQNGLDVFLAVLARCDSDPLSFTKSAQHLSRVLQSLAPSNLPDLRLGIPSAFSRLDLTHFDVLALGRRFIERYPDRMRPILLLGLRTAGTYFSAMLRSFLKAEGYHLVASLTLQPMKGPGQRERKELTRYARQGFTILIVDDPPHTGGAISLAVDIARQAGFDLPQIRVLIPTHPAARNWADALPDELVITLEPERWRKQQLLDPKGVENRLAEYLAWQGCTDIRVTDSRRADELNADLQKGSKRGAALKRIFEVQLRSSHGHNETRYVLAKSVGSGYLGYSAFLVAHRLSDFVPPVLGLRDGILYSEWLPQHYRAGNVRSHRDLRIDTTAAYVAARTRLLSLPKRRAPGKAVHENGLRLLAETLGRAYGSFGLNILMQSFIKQQLCHLHCPFPTLIDGNMDCTEWIESESGPLKTGYYGHGLGKNQLNAIDPAYDLAETILSFELSSDEEDRLVRRYVEYSGDEGVSKRLFINKLLAGLWTIDTVQEKLFGVAQDRQQELHRRFLGAWDFLTAQTVRLCGTLCRPSRSLSWHGPLVVLDVDGVIDRRVFGYPCTTAAGINALSRLATYGYSVALNTARSIHEVKDYCEAYGLTGGVAENGAYLWDAVAKRGQPLIDQETMAQLEVLRKQLRQIPGIFLDDRHRYSIRAYIIEKKPSSSLLRLLNSIRSFSVGMGAPMPLPTLVLKHFIATLRLDRLSFHHTTIDTAIVARGIDKGTGLTALRDLILGGDTETIAIGDSEADLPMFRAATRSFAPAQISCRRQARLLGCAVSRYPYQRGLMDIVRTLVGPGPRSEPIETDSESEGEALFLDALRAMDRLPVRALIRALLDRTTFKIFMR